MKTSIKDPSAKKRWRFSLRYKLILGFSLIAAFASFITTLGIYRNSQNQVIEGYKNNLLGITRMAALQQNGDDFAKVLSDQDPLYEKIRIQNTKIRNSNPDLVFVYTMRKDEQGIYFVVDAGEKDDEGFSAFNERYIEPSQTLVDNFDIMETAIVEPDFYTDEYGTFLSAYAPIFSSNGTRVGVIGVDILANTIAKQQRSSLVQAIFVFLITLGLGIFFGYLAGNALTKPVIKLTQGSLAFASGRLDERIEVKSTDEFSDLANTFNNMAGEIQDLINSLELRVAERTHEIEHRSILLKSVADVGKAITSFRELSELLQKTVYLIEENFGYYHIGIFLLDEYKEFAVLTATNSEGGRRLLEKKHQLKVGETSIVGYVTQNARPRIALDVGQDAVYFDNPDLPNTRSEMALPLAVGGQILGALDVQSTESQAFSQEDTSSLQILADQLAVAIQNANLFSDTEKALEASRSAYRELSHEAWSKILRNQTRIGFIATPPTTTQTNSEILEPSIAKAFESGDIIIGSDDLTISLPVKVRGQSIGAIRLKKAEISEAWTQEETNLAIALADQISAALESARLYRESQQRGAREAIVSDISSRISAVSNTETILRETVQELGQTLGNASVIFQLIDQFNGQEPVNNQEERSEVLNNTRKVIE
jgi:GAF domain-containing protein/HAMP domain-containing protein